MTAGRIAALVAIVAACGDSPADLPPDPFADLPVWTLAAEPELRIGRFDGPDEYTFSGVMDAGLAGDTLIVVADGGANEIRLYDLDGSFVRAMGGPGSGPGELQNVWRIEIGDGTVAGWDQRLMRLSTFSLDGELVESVQWRTPPYAGTPFFVGLGTDGTGYARLRGGGDHESIMGRFEGRSRDTAVYGRCGPDGMCEPISRVPGEEQIVRRSDHGFSIHTAFLGRTPAATVIGNALVVGSTDSLYLERIAPDGSRQPLVRQTLAPRPFTDHDWEAYRESMEKLIARAEEEGMDYGGIDRPAHPTYPPFDAIEAGRRELVGEGVSGVRTGSLAVVGVRRGRTPPGPLRVRPRSARIARYRPRGRGRTGRARRRVGRCLPRRAQHRRGGAVTRFEQVQPVLPTRDVRAAIGFYVDRLGFSLAFRDSEDDPRYACVRRDGVELHLQWHDPAEWERVERPMLRFVVPDIEALFDEYGRRDVFHAKTALRDTPWGTREFAFYDRDMNGLTFYRDL